MKQNLSPSASLRLCVKILTLASCFAGSFPTRAASSISDVLVSQRWPWSEKVDVDFTLTGEKADIDVSATWDGQSSVLLGTVFDAAPDGENGAWSDEYKTSKMVFRRIPAGTYTLGEPKNTFKFFGANDTDAETYYKIAGTRTVTFTSDFYVGVFCCTTAQRSWLENGCAGGDTCAVKLSYDALRGGRASDLIDWPNAWGFYDIVGGGVAEWVLDSSTYFNSAGTLPNAQKSGANLTDPVGGHCSKNYRIYRSHSGYGKTTTLM